MSHIPNMPHVASTDTKRHKRRSCQSDGMYVAVEDSRSGSQHTGCTKQKKVVSDLQRSAFPAVRCRARVQPAADSSAWRMCRFAAHTTKHRMGLEKMEHLYGTYATALGALQ